MMKQKIYTIGGYRFRLAPMVTIRKARIDSILLSVGITDMMQLLEFAANEMIVMLDDRKVLDAMFEESMEFVDSNIFLKWLRLARMKFTGTTKLSIIQLKMEPDQKIEVFTDFFISKLGVTLSFSNFLKRMASSLKETMQAGTEGQSPDSISSSPLQRATTPKE